ncbi:MAG: 2OG-Fe(II) oxygenase family protein [Candidatus Pacebacteria bacterium]|nr:2OG-Fe(II) oxygenase family protein [Candidatus Paceibacterota bacterium]
MDLATFPKRRIDFSRHFQAMNAELAIMRNGYTEAPIEKDFLKSRFNVVRTGMRRITNDPALQTLFNWHIHDCDAYGTHYAQEVGLTFRNDTERKWTFQYTPEAYCAQRYEQSDVGAFMSALHDLDSKAREISLPLAARFDARRLATEPAHRYPGSMAKRIREGRCITRVLRYPWNSANDAHPHFDRSLFSIHWGATHPGLVLFDNDYNRTRVRDVGFESVLVFPGRKYAAIGRGDFGFGTPHGVRNERTTGEDRYTIVSFVHPVADGGDVAWLLSHHDEIQAFAKTLSL